MAETSLCRMRLQEYRDIAGGILENIPNHIRAAQPQLLSLHISGTPADVVGFSEISAPTTKADVATAVKVETVSSAEGDNLTAAADAKKINVICIQNDKLDVVEMSMHPTDGRIEVLHDELLKEVFHSYCVAWGTTGKDAKGNIDVRSIADVVWVRILAATNESNGSSFKVPDGHVAMLFGGKLTRLAKTTDEGNRIRLIYTDTIDAIGVDSLLNNWVEFVANGAIEQYTVIQKGHMFKPKTWIQFKHSSLVDAGEAYDLILDFLIWKK